MNARRIHASSNGPCTWRERLARPSDQWKREQSAFELAVAWEKADRDEDNESGIPPRVFAMLDHESSTIKNARLLFGAIEHKVPLPGSSKPSQSDLWVVLGSSCGLVSATIEGKVDEDFDDILEDWLAEPKEESARNHRLAVLNSLERILGFQGHCPMDIRYQLLHRTAAAVIEARRIGAHAAAMIVHSFAKDTKAEPDHFEDMRRFAAVLGAEEFERNRLVEARNIIGGDGENDITLNLGWAEDSFARDEDIVSKIVEWRW